ncbi:hypothetical protein BN961_02619 [Afipia felis]|uniref:Uncharacterized protein n=2 Tax=Afipia felis TaxID=1035 RepID=A0A090MPA1_AFIFE|nr:hypothetical protein [Afipia felis]EKS28351.1 hypothetical protein HMPREF9697_00879 [Afipia felis ATCC 53690]CEG09196.1 hypothetical protein BN961_02619 [Afipia felis]SUU77060.1 Uncharacterised protein [Afipia felis]SUU85127.1 Uncharacterised protein [Afipia felis]
MNKRAPIFIAGALAMASCWFSGAWDTWPIAMVFMSAFMDDRPTMFGAAQGMFGMSRKVQHRRVQPQQPVHRRTSQTQTLPYGW